MVAEILSVLNSLFTVIFVVTSMLAMGFGLTLGQIIAPLRDWKVVVFALLASFIIVPAAAFLLKTFIPMEQDYQIGLMLVATAAGAPMLPKLAQIAKGAIALSVGLMTLLMVGTVIYLPIVLPLLLPGVTVNPMEVASSLVVLMLIPLAIALFVHSRWVDVADYLRPKMAQASTLGLIWLIGTTVLLNWRLVLQTVGTGALLSILLLVAVALATGYFLGGSAPGAKPVMALGTAQRNLAAATVVASGNFADQPNVLVLVIVAGVIMMAILFPLAGEFGRRAPAPKAVPAAAMVRAGGSSGRKK
jgi:predicted Na+-dependent transporter